MPGLAFTCPPDCAKCCNTLVKHREPEEEEFLLLFDEANREQGIYTTNVLASRGIVLTPEEARRLRAQSRRRGARARILPHTFLLDRKANTAVVVSYRMDHAQCPFTEGYRCGVYEDRPMPCRAFPVMVGAPQWSLSPVCPLVPEAEEKRAAKVATYREQFTVEAAARRAIGRSELATEERLMALLGDSARAWKRGLPQEKALALLKAWRHVDLDALA